MFIKNKWFPRNSNSCITFNRVCPYINICDSRNLNTIKTMLDSIKPAKPDIKEFNPEITIDVEISDV